MNNVAGSVALNLVIEVIKIVISILKMNIIDVNYIQKEYNMKNYNTIIKELNLEDEKIINCYHYGSYVYNTHTEKSDFDFIIIYKNDNNEILELNKRNNVNYENINANNQSDGIWSKDEQIQATIYSHSKFIEMIKEHKIEALESIFLNNKYKLKETIDYKKYFELDLDKLRRSISAVCSNSYVKCMKKMTREHLKDTVRPKSYYDYIGKKSLFHSLRIGMYGIQVAKCGKINDYIKLNNKYTTMTLWDEINTFKTWEELKNKYQNYANNIRSEFRIVAPLKK